MIIVHKIKYKLVVLLFSHSNPANPSVQEQLPSKQAPPFMQEKSAGQTKCNKNRQCSHHDKSTKIG